MSQTENGLRLAALQSSAGPVHAHEGLRVPGTFGRWPAIGLILFLVGAILFAVLLINVQTNGPLIQPDTQISNEVHVEALQSPPLERDVMIAGFYVGEQAIVAIGGLLSLYYLLKRYWTELIIVLVAWLGEGGIWLFLAQHVNRPRPVFAVPVWMVLPPPGFPSGHSFAAVICFSFLAYIIMPKITPRWGKALVAIVALLIVLYVGYSRVFLGEHFPMDVLAGYALGIAWSGIVFTGVEYIARKRKERQTAHAA